MRWRSWRIPELAGVEQPFTKRVKIFPARDRYREINIVGLPGDLDPQVMRDP